MQRFRNISTAKDLKLVKAQIKNEMLEAEKDLFASFALVESIFTLSGFFTKFTSGFSVAQRVILTAHKYIVKFMNWRSKKKKKKQEKNQD
ncbi:MAG: hypothetical protein ACLFQS_11345 [Bacteroidales bacterium]